MSTLSLITILSTLKPDDPPAPQNFNALVELELADQQRCQAFGITPATVETQIAARVKLFTQTQKILSQDFPDLMHVENSWITLWQLWLPLALKLLREQQSLQQPLIQGILGGQGTGKSTLTAILTVILGNLGCRAIRLSLDDCYKTYQERKALQRVDPRLIWRGPPGTHDLELALSVLRQFHAGVDHLALPQFDKSAWEGAGDRTSSQQVKKADILLFEGWFVGVQPLPESQLLEQLNTENFPPISTESDRQFALDMNRQLENYLPLWQELDRLMILVPTDYRFSKQWRQDAEQQMKSQGKSGMTSEEINEFVDYFWKALHPLLFIEPLLQDREKVNLVVKINQNHSLAEIY